MTIKALTIAHMHIYFGCSHTCQCNESYCDSIKGRVPDICTALFTSKISLMFLNTS